MKQATSVQVPSRPDRRVQRTREALRSALLELIEERGWDGIDVQALCERANVGRSTFYLHFPNKEELLKGSLASMRAVLLEEVQRSGANAPDQLAFVGGLIAHVHQQQKAFRALLGRRSGQFVQDRFRELLVDMVEQEQPAGPKPSWQAAAMANFLGGALFQLLTWWLGTNRPHPPQEIEALFRALSKPVLQNFHSALLMGSPLRRSP